jgi:ABC-type transporter Mla MlaB component
MSRRMSRATPMPAGRPLSSRWRVGPNGMATHESSTIAFVIGAPIERADLPGLFARVCELLEGANGRMVVCDVSDARADAVTADALARLGLAARRNGCQVTLCHVSAELRALIAFMGLAEILLEDRSASPDA